MKLWLTLAGRIFSRSRRHSLSPQRRLEGIELEGWSIKGPQSYSVPREVAENPDGQAAGTGEVKFPNNDSQLNTSFERLMVICWTHLQTEACWNTLQIALGISSGAIYMGQIGMHKYNLM